MIARLLSDLAQARQPGDARRCLSILVLEDFAMAAYLPLLAVLAAGGSWLQALFGMGDRGRGAQRGVLRVRTDGDIMSVGSLRTRTTSRCCCASSV